MDSCRPDAPPDIDLPMQRSSRAAHEEPVTSSGHVTFDDRGQAVWKWERPPQPQVTGNPTGARSGYDPYGRERPVRSGKDRPARKDLRKLDEWIRLRKQAQQNGREP